MAISAELPAQLGAAVLDTAREAFVHGMQLTSGIAAVVAVGLAIMAFLTLRSHGVPPSEPESDIPPAPVAPRAAAEFQGSLE